MPSMNGAGGRGAGELSCRGKRASWWPPGSALGVDPLGLQGPPVPPFRVPGVRWGEAPQRPGAGEAGRGLARAASAAPAQRAGSPDPVRVGAEAATKGQPRAVLPAEIKTLGLGLEARSSFVRGELP